MTYSVGIIGATGAVGRQMIEELATRKLLFSDVRPFATRRSQDELLSFGGEILKVQTIDPASAADSFAGLNLVLSSAGKGPIKELAPIAVEAGAVVIDNSSAFRMDEKVPLVVPEVNPEALEGHSGIVANPNCSTIQMVVVLKPIFEAVGIKRVVVSTYQSASGIGHKGVEELEAAAMDKLGVGTLKPPCSVGEEETAAAGFEPVVFPANIGFNLFPLIDRMEEGCHVREEIKMVNETRKILGAPDLPVSATTVRVPVFVGHALALWIETEKKLSRDECIDVMRDAPGVVAFDEMAGEATPTPLDVEEDEMVRVGRMREDPCNENCIMLWAVGNNLRKGAATNTVQIAEEMAKRGLL
jgi:aspartate-semialdehyde dehydrogenase